VTIIFVHFRKLLLYEMLHNHVYSRRIVVFDLLELEIVAMWDFQRELKKKKEEERRRRKKKKEEEEKEEEKKTRACTSRIV
jgi:5'-3' exonuclease